MDDLLREFLTETNEGLGVLDVELVKLEQNPNDPDLLSNIFRLMHTIKGTCGFLGLPRLEAVAHSGENVLGRVRDGDLEVTPDVVSIILECLDRIRMILETLEATEAEPAGDDAELIQRLDAYVADEGGVGVPSADVVSFDGPTLSEEELEAAFQAAEGPAPEALAEPVAEAAEETPAAAVAAAVAVGEAKEPAAAPQGEAAHKGSAVANQSIRVNVDLLENLMTTVSELVLTRNQLLQILRSQKESDFAAPLQRLNHVVSELQEGVMKTRMQPIGNAWAKLPRIVRDLSLELGKKIELVMKGADTELDRQVLDLIKDPLTHMVRNSADHGLERPEERRESGKGETGTITLNAFHEGGHIIIQIADDGRGLNIERIKQKALGNGLVSETDLAGMTDQQIMQFIFKPGFSTAEAVTAVSGRGVGMDVVRSNIEKIGGTVELSSRPYRGSVFTIKIPLTLAIVSSLIVECSGERFAIPQISVVELVRASSNSEHTIERIKGTPVLRLRDRLLPLVNLRGLLRLDDGAGQESLSDDHFIVVSKVGTYSFGILVDRVFDTEEIVVKPVAPILRDITLFSGNTILGDGSVVMILDPNGIAQATGEISVTDTSAETKEQRAAASEERVAMLVFRAGSKAPKAVPLALVARLEEIDLAKVESSDGHPVVQYRGQLMPLVTIGDEVRPGEEGEQPVLVFADRNRHVGLLVDEIVDIVEDRLNIELTAERTGFIGTAVIGGKATDIIDTGHFLTRGFKDWFRGSDGDGETAEEGNRVLLVDDSPFFLNMITPLLAAAGYHVTPAQGAEAALALCEAGERFDAIISDIEMPGMNGFDFATAVRRGGAWAETPLIALTSRTSPREVARGRSVGFDDYVAKFDREALLASLQDTLTDFRGAA